MITNCHRHLLLFATIIMFAELFLIVSCTSDRVKIISTDGKIRISPMKNHLSDVLKQEQLYDAYDKEIKRLASDIFKSYLRRRASAFYAMRGKRSTRTV